MTSPARLRDTYSRDIRYLRLSVTDRCDFRCIYCMAEDMVFMPRSEILSIEELARTAQVFTELGVDHIRITGGEPLVRPGVIELTQRLANLPKLQQLSMTTNGARLKEFAEPLIQAGMQRVNISLDTLNPSRFKQLTRYGNLAAVLAGIDAAISAGFKQLKINSVLMKNYNLDEAGALTAFALERGMDISFIEEMPLGNITSHSRSAEFVTSSSLRQQLQETFELSPSQYQSAGPSRYWQVRGYANRVGFISAHSDNFCATCNRVRVSAAGQLLLCLGNEDNISLRNLLRQHPNDNTAIKEAIIKTMPNKPKQHHFELSEPPQILRFMNASGG